MSNVKKLYVLILALPLCLVFIFSGCEGSPQEKEAKAQKAAIEGYMQGLFGGDVQKFLRYSSIGYFLHTLRESRTANLFVSAESTRAQMAGGFKGWRF
ncbi:hypothetical protein [Helicobacter typhlonius]|uniref:hypothetical protein n=2 Tax=Helicobacter typhlonius TaxID=76936 RepID=UPI002FDF61B1